MLAKRRRGEVPADAGGGAVGFAKMDVARRDSAAILERRDKLAES